MNIIFLFFIFLVQGICCAAEVQEISKRSVSIQSQLVMPAPTREYLECEHDLVQDLWNAGLISNPGALHFIYPEPSLARIENPETDASEGIQSARDNPNFVIVVSAPTTSQEDKRLDVIMPVVRPRVSLCHRLWPWVKPLVPWTPDLSYGVILTTALTTDDDVALKIFLASTIPYSIYFLCNVPKRIRHCLKTIFRQSERVFPHSNRRHSAPVAHGKKHRRGHSVPINHGKKHRTSIAHSKKHRRHSKPAA